METRRKIRLSLALSIVVAAAIPAGNCLTNSLVGVMFPTPVPSSSNGSSSSSSSNHQTTAPSAVSAAAIHQVESKRMEQWSPSPPDLSHHMQQQHQPQTSYGLPSYSQQPVHNSQPFMPANYYLPVNDEPTIGNNYGTAAATEFRSDHYPYPFDPPTAYAYPIAAQPQVDTSLIPTAKHFVIVSFIGLLLLFAIIQNSIAAAKRKDALVEVLSNRRKRELDEANYQLLQQPAEAELTRKEDLRIRCVQRNLCLENRKLREDLGVFGKVLAKYLTRSVQGSLREISSDWDDLVEDAASAGLKGDDCYQVYDNCEANSSDVDNNNNNSATNEDETKT
ncbi:uncharacterized protein LOC106658227 [Trichogramma pretiosum]|uniref:uncharacterized protein LOC106658227 n=1 Tax=Trichogramma pretiosum TaxID=7493 RepID=UPI000C71AEF7|nr:uncharacterized protein LOC106658227 [Trichogramma pretiosum]